MRESSPKPAPDENEVEWVETLRPYFSEHGIYITLFLSLIICGIGLPIPEEALFLAAGFAGAKFGADPWLLCAVGIAGVLIGDLIPFLIGRKYGTGLLQKPFFARFRSEKYLERARRFFERYGAPTILIARFLAGLRTPTFIVAGTLGMRVHIFLVWDTLGALISCPTSIWLSFTYGEQAIQMIKNGETAVLIVLCVVVLAIVLTLALRKKTESAEPLVPGPIRWVFYHLTNITGSMLLRIFFRYSVVGREKIPDGPVVLVANHASFIDPILIAGTTWRWVRFLMYASFYESAAKPVFRFFACVPVDEKRFLDAIRTGSKLLERGDCLGIFPEGAVSYDGKLLPAKPGALFLAQRTGAPVVPITIVGNHDVLPRGAWIPRLRKLTLIVGDPFQVGKDLSRKDVERKLDDVMAEFARNLGQEWPPKVPVVFPPDPIPPVKYY